MEKIINEKYIEESLGKTSIRPMDIFKKAEDEEELDLSETVSLLNSDTKKLRQIAESVVKERFPEKEFFTGFYIANTCTEECDYCGFNKKNRMERKRLSPDEIAEEVEIITDIMDVNDILLCHPTYREPNHTDDIVQAVKIMRRNPKVRKIIIEAYPLSEENLRKIRDSGADQYTIFQETYREGTYNKLHPVGSKSGYYERLHSHDRAINAGFQDLGIGVLWGLADPIFDVLALKEHAEYLHGRDANIYISVPRYMSHKGESGKFRCLDDNTFKKIVYTFAATIPFAKLVLSGRESVSLRNELSPVITVFGSAGGTYPGEFSDRYLGRNLPLIEHEKGQFVLNDRRTPSQLKSDLYLN